MARFWWRGSSARDQVRAALAADLAGRWLDDGELEREGCRFAGHEYGDDVFLLDPGRLMVPSFMGSRPVRAMHGYSPSHPDMAALLWSNRPLPAEVRHLVDVREFLERELDARDAADVGPSDRALAAGAPPARATRVARVGEAP
jgi:hypothetical protein